MYLTAIFLGILCLASLAGLIYFIIIRHQLSGTAEKDKNLKEIVAMVISLVITFLATLGSVVVSRPSSAQSLNDFTASF